MTTIRLQKYLSERGVSSRRHAADLIREGRVKVAGKIVTEPGHRIPERGVHIRIDEHIINAEIPQKKTIMLHKPRGYICSKASQSFKTPIVYTLIKSMEYLLLTVGRLDKESEGLILMSNDGDLIHKLTHPSFSHTKTYEVTVLGNVNPHALITLRSRLILDGYRIHPAKVEVLSQSLNETILQFIII